MKTRPIAIILTVACLMALAIPGRGQQFDVVGEIAQVMSDLLSVAPNRQLYRSAEKRIAYAQDIHNAAIGNQVPDLLLTVKIYNESSFRNACSAPTNGPVTCGELQMHGAATNGCDTSTRQGRLDCGAFWLRTCYDKCGTWPRALACYGTSGHCDWQKAQRPKAYRHSIRRQIKMWQTFEEQRQHVRAEIISDLEFAAELREE